MSETEVDVEFEAEHEWRVEQLEKEGFTHFQAFRLSISGADWHDAKNLLRSGCDPETVIDILI